MKKFMLRIMPVLLVGVLMSLTFVSAVDIPGGSASGAVTRVAGNIWATIRTVLYLVAVAAVVFAGVRYMTSNADMKAEIKGSLIGLAVGAVFVFGATKIIDLIISASGEMGV